MSHEINEEIIQELAHLAKIKLTPQEVQKTIPQIKKILNHFDELTNLNTDSIEPLITPVEIQSHLRTDSVNKKIETKELLELAPDKMGFLYKVPPAIG